MRVERELACDDRVIAAGTEPRAYAGHLLEIAYAAGSDRAPALALTMARPHQLEGRMLAALDAARNRRLLTVRVRVAAAAASIALLVGLACAAPAVRAAERDRDVSQSIWSSARPAIDHVRASWRAFLDGRLSAADLVRMAANQPRARRHVIECRDGWLGNPVTSLSQTKTDKRSNWLHLS
jgi:hypothetical protein